MKRVIILNKFGVDANSSAADKEPLPYIVDNNSDGATYVCFFETGSNPRAIHRISAGTLGVAYGEWSKRTTLQYGEPNKNIVINIEVEI